ncbi:MAG: carbon storage regulator CsrA [Phycisphaerae bacterium]
MLVLSRQRDESIKIGDEIEITIVDIRGEKVRLGISAPPHIPVHRKEVYEAIQRENEQNAKAKGTSPGRVESLAKRNGSDKDADQD